MIAIIKIVNKEMAKGDHSLVCFSARPMGTNLVGRLNGVDGDVFVTG